MIMDFSDVTLHNLINCYQCFKWTCYHFNPEERSSKLLRNTHILFTRLHGITS